MAYGRREIAPSDQIKALRHARDQYVQLADRIHNDVDPALDGAEKQLREDNARRIAKAYDRSLSNSVARLAGMERTHRLPTRSFGLWYRIGVLLVLAIACALPFTYRYMPTLNRLFNMRDVVTGAPIDAPAKIPAPAIVEQKPLPEKPEAPKNLEMAAQKPAIAAAGPAKVAPPPAPAANKPAVKPREAKQETAKARPAAAAAPKAPEVTKASIPTEPPLPAPPAAPLPAPVEMPAPPTPQVAAAPPPVTIRPEPIMETHTQPPYPASSARAGETGTTKISVAISPQGQATDCRITQTSGADRLDRAACAHVTDRWRWRPVSRDRAAPAPRITVTMIWNLRRPAPQR